MQQMQAQKQNAKWPTRLRIIGFILALLILIGGAIAWAVSSLSSQPALFAAIFGAVSTIFTFLTLVPIIFPPKSSEPAQPVQTQPPAQPPINIYNYFQPPSPVPPAPVQQPTPPPSPSPAAPSPVNALSLSTFPLPTDPHSIQQREQAVKDIYTLLIAPDTSAVALTGIGGSGKSTLAALVLNYAERERKVGRGPFHSEPILLRVEENTTFSELATNLFAAVNKFMPDDLSHAPFQQQAFAIFHALQTADTPDMPRLLILDQFENLLDQQSGTALPTRTGVGELLNALNSQSCACRILLTSRPRPQGTRKEAQAALRVYPVGKLNTQESIALLRNQGVTGSEAELQKAVDYCDGHPLSLTLLSTLLQSYAISLSTLLNDPTYQQLWEDDIAQNLLDRIFTSLPEPSRQLLRAFSVYREAVPIEAPLAIIDNTPKAQLLTTLLWRLLGKRSTAVTNTPKTQFLATLSSLLGQHLVQAPVSDGYYQLHPIVATYARQHFVANDETANKQTLQAAHARAAHYYLQIAKTQRPPKDKRRHTSEVQPLLEAVWQYCQAGQCEEAYELMNDENLFESLSLWGANTLLLELCRLLLSENWPYTLQQKAHIYSYMADTLSVLGQKQEALHYYQDTLLINREVKDRRSEGVNLSDLGRLYDDLGQHQEALRYYQDALLINREVGDRLDEGTILNNVGRVYHDLGQQQEALRYYLDALPIRKEVNDRRGEGTTLNNLGRVYDVLGQKQEALHYYQDALLIRKEVGDRLGEGITLDNIGIMCFELGHYEVALACFLLAKDIYEQVQSPRVNGVVQWIARLREYVGETDFTALLAQVEPRAEEIVEEALRKGLGKA